MSQTSYSNAPSEGLAGLPYYGNGRAMFNRSYIAAEAMAYGFLAARGDGDELCIRPATEAAVLAGLGFTLRNDAKEPGTTVGILGYEDADMVPVAYEGFLWVPCETAATRGGNVFIRFTTDLSDDLEDTDLGAVRNDADGGKAVALPGAKFERSIGAAGLVPISFRMMGLSGLGATGPTGAGGATGPTGPTGPA
jgi:hypothetical protein